jgi:hypothetical protein
MSWHIYVGWFLRFIILAKPNTNILQIKLNQIKLTQHLCYQIWIFHKPKQEVLGRTNRLLSFYMTQTAHKMCPTAAGNVFSVVPHKAT